MKLGAQIAILGTGLLGLFWFVLSTYAMITHFGWGITIGLFATMTSWIILVRQELLR